MVSAMFEGLSMEDVIQLNPNECRRGLTPIEIEMIFKACDAFWRHPGKRNPQAPHVILTSDKHSNLYINCPLVLQRSNLCQIVAQQLVYLLQLRYDGPIDWVTGSDSSALGISKDVANLLGAKWHPMQKGPDETKTQIWEKAVIECEEWVLHIEELLTTSITTQAVRDGIKKGNPNQVNFVPFIPIVVHRPDKGVPEKIDGSKPIWLLYYDDAYVVDPEEEECEFCKNGSQALSGKDHWDQLKATM
jgi:orotate phosphoribosyltransferase